MAAQPSKQPSWRTAKGSSSERGYGHKWQKARLRFLGEHPLCVMCEKQGRITVATVVDHKIPHKGDQELFWDESNWQSLCKPHHDRDKAEEEGRHRVRAKFDANGRVIW